MKTIRVPVTSRTSTVCGYPGRDFDWSKACWDGSAIHNGPFVVKASETAKARKAFLPSVTRLGSDYEYLNVPWNWAEDMTVYRVRPNESMQAGSTFRGYKVVRQRAVQVEGKWYWELQVEEVPRV